MTTAEKALSTFRQPPHSYNCAQTVCAAFGREDLLEEMAACGGGRAPEGMCGALYGATRVLPDKAQQIIEAFRAENGAIHCRELKGANRVPCTQCVRCAATLVESLQS